MTTAPRTTRRDFLRAGAATLTAAWACPGLLRAATGPRPSTPSAVSDRRWCVRWSSPLDTLTSCAAGGMCAERRSRVVR